MSIPHFSPSLSHKVKDTRSLPSLQPLSTKAVHIWHVHEHPPTHTHTHPHPHTTHTHTHTLTLTLNQKRMVLVRLFKTEEKHVLTQASPRKQYTNSLHKAVGEELIVLLVNQQTLLHTDSPVTLKKSNLVPSAPLLESVKERFIVSPITVVPKSIIPTSRCS